MGKYQIRKFEKADVEFVKAHQFILGLAFEYDRDYDIKNAFTVVDEEAQVIGVGILAYHVTWYNPDATHQLVLEYCLTQDEAFSEIIKGSQLIISKLKQAYPKKNIQLIYFEKANELKEVQRFLKHGFCFGQLIPVLKYDLSKGIQHEILPKTIQIRSLEKEEAEAYIEATEKADCAESLGEFLFRSNDEQFKTFVACEGSKIVGGISIWQIEKDRGATENIFTLPGYRRKKIASELIATAFETLKARHIKYATLSMLGDNAEAMRLYQKIGYELSDYLVELKQDVNS